MWNYFVNLCIIFIVLTLAVPLTYKLYKIDKSHPLSKRYFLHIIFQLVKILYLDYDNKTLSNKVVFYNNHHNLVAHATLSQRPANILYTMIMPSCMYAFTLYIHSIVHNAYIHVVMY